MIDEQSYAQHEHDGTGTKNIRVRNVIKTYTFVSADLAKFIALPAEDGDIFTNFDGTNYEIYVRMNTTWKKATLS